jgi:hypothetical protein
LVLQVADFLDAQREMCASAGIVEAAERFNQGSVGAFEESSWSEFLVRADVLQVHSEAGHMQGQSVARGERFRQARGV